MMSPRQIFCVCAIAVAGFVAPSPAAAQSDPGATRVTARVSGTVGAGHAAPTVGAAVSYRFAPRLAVEGDLAYFPDLTLTEFSEGAGTTSWHARATSITANVTLEVPSPLGWLQPYLSAGGGAARVRRDTRGLSFCDPCEPRIYMKPVVSIGGGVDLLVRRGVAVGVDVRYQRVFEDERLFRPNLRNLKRIGSFVSYRF
jgi:opacity protein-like surface antigen